MVGGSSSPAATTERSFVSLYPWTIILGNHGPHATGSFICSWIFVPFIDRSVNALTNPYLIDPGKLFLSQLGVAGAKYIKQRESWNSIILLQNSVIVSELTYSLQNTPVRVDA
jgi:hypothetical protein